MFAESPKVVISYARADADWVTRLTKTLAPAIVASRLDVWDDRKIVAGANWEAEIQKALRSADLAVLMVSQDYLASDYVTHHELPLILDRWHAGELGLVWIAVSSALFELTPLADIQAGNDPKRPLASMSASECDAELVRLARTITTAQHRRNDAGHVGRARATATVLLSDIEGSTELWERHGDAMFAVVQRHNRLATTSVERHQGLVGRLTGDGILGVFSMAEDALQAAVHLRDTIATEAWPSGAAIAVRIGVNTGSCRLDLGDVVGPAPNLAARLEQAAHGGQILVSQATVDQLAGVVPSGLALDDVGTFRVRGFSEPVKIYEVRGGLDHGRRPPPRLPSASDNELPEPFTRFVGRSLELDDVMAAIRRDPIVEIWGSKGIGKSRLVTEVAHRLRADLGTALYVDASEVTSIDAFWSKVVGVARVRVSPSESPGEAVVRTLVDRSALAVFDNVDGLSGELATTAQALARERSIRLIVTARARPSLPGATSFELGPLALPSPFTVDVRALAKIDSIALFVDRARLADPHFVLDDSTARAVGEICRRADGVPAVIEAIGRQLDVKSVEELADRSQQDGWNLADPTTMADWLTALHSRPSDLTDDDRATVQSVTAFVGPFTREAALDTLTGLLGVDCDPTAAARRLDQTFDALVRRAVLVRDPADRRYQRLLVPAREAGESLLGVDDRRRRAVRYCAVMVERAERTDVALRDHRESEAVAQFELELDDHRRAMELLIDAGEWAAAIRLLRALFQFSLFQLRPEVFVWARRLLASSGADSSPGAADLLGIAAMGAWFTGDLEAAIRLANGGIDAAAAGQGSALWARTALIDALSFAGRFDELPLPFRAHLATLRSDPDAPFWLVNADGFAALGYTELGLRDEANRAAESAIDRSRRLENPDAIGWAHFAKARVVASNDHPAAIVNLEIAMAAYRSVGSRHNLALALAAWCQLNLRGGDSALTARGLIDLIDLLGESGCRAHLVQALSTAAALLKKQGDDHEAATVLLALRGLPQMPRGAVVEATDAELMSGLERRFGREWSTVVAHARSLTEPRLLARVRHALLGVAHAP